MSNIGWGSTNDPAHDARCARPLQSLRQLVEGRAGGHHVVHHRDPLAGEASPAGEGAPHVALSRCAVEPGLRRRIALARAGVELEPAAEMACDLDRLVVAALAQPL